MRKLKKLYTLLGIILVLATVAGCNQTTGGTQTTTTSPVVMTTKPITATPSATATTAPAAATTPQDTTTTLLTIKEVRDISISEAYALIQENKGNPDFIIIDIRTREEFDTGHIENAILIDYYAENFREELNKLDRNKTYLEYCRTARRSGLALEVFKELGFTNVLNMSGGIVEWVAKGYPTVK